MEKLITEDGRVNAKISKFKLALKECLIENDNNNIKWIFQRLGNLDDKIQSTKYLQSHHPEWIGCTVLHLAGLYRYEMAYETLINNQANFTIKNNEGATPVHAAIESHLTKGHRLMLNCTIDAAPCHAAIERSPITSHRWRSRFTPDYIIGETLSAHLIKKNFENPSNKNGLSHFHIACFYFDDEFVELIEQFLNNGVPIDHAVNMDSTISAGYTGLHFAVENRRLKTTKALLSYGANTQIKDAKGMTPLHKLLKSYLEIVDPTCAEEYESNGPNEAKAELLSQLSSCSDIECAIKLSPVIIKLFLNHDNQDCIGLSQLHLACTIRDLDETERFVKKATDINHQVNMESSYWPGYTALHFASHFDLDTVKLLLKNGAHLGAKDARGVTPLDICLRRYESSDIHTIILLVPDWKRIVLSDGKTKLSDVLSAMTDADRFKKFLRRLLKNLHVHVPNDSTLWPGFSLMHLAVVLENVEGDQSMVPILEELFTRAPTLLNHQEIRGWTSLHLAYRLQKYNVTEALIKYHVTFTNFTDAVDEEGLSHTHIACTTKNSEFLEKLLHNGSNVNAVFKGSSINRRGITSGSTPLHFAVVHNIENALRTLLDYNVDIYAKDDNGMTPIHLMVADRTDYRCVDILRNLEDLEDSVVDGVGLSHLHVACLKNHSVGVSTLIKNGANVRQKLTTELITTTEMSRLNDWRGCTPLEIALKKGFPRCAVLFSENEFPDFLVNNYDLIPDLLAKRYDCSVYLSQFMTDVDLQARLKKDFGITALHLACWSNFCTVRFDEDGFDDVNTRVREDSPIWPGCTPVHVFLNTAQNDLHGTVIDRLVEAGVDILLADVNGETVVHIVYRCYLNNRKLFPTLGPPPLLNTLLQLQSDFSVNPTSIEGISHFHIACAVGNADVVEKFLQRGLVDVNRPIDFFRETEAGQTPLHLVASTSIEDASMRLRTVDLLLKNGADVHAENSRGNTALHECARGESVNVFERIVKGGADVNARNILGHTPLKYFLSKYISFEEIKVLLRVGCHLNAFNPINEEGCFGEALCSKPREQIKNFISALEDHPSTLIDKSDARRTIVHNIAASAGVTGENYVTLIAELSKIGYDIDDKDKMGRTPLHLAARTQSVQGIVALLASGADVNLTDNEGKTIIRYCIHGCYRCRDLFDELPEIGDDYYDIHDEGYHDFMPCRHIKMLKLLAIHARKLLYCGLDVSEDCSDDLDEVTDIYDEVRNLPDRFFVEFEAVKKLTIGSHEFPLSELLSENDAVIDYPTMSLAKRNLIDNFFRSDDYHKFRREFREMAGIVQLQYRKAVARNDLVDRAQDSLMILSGIRLDDLCYRIISKMLKNSELRSLIAAANNEENAWG